MIITIDGPSGTGKTTIAKLLAEKLGFDYFDTGAMYRAITWFLLQSKSNLEVISVIEKTLKTFAFSFELRNQKKHYFVGFEDVTAAIRSNEVTRAVSHIATLRPVREIVWKMQRQLGEGKNAVFEGRDMGTVVFPNAEVKIFLTARPEVRAERRLKEFEGNPDFLDMDYDQMLQEMMNRDQLDSTRKLAPLKQAEDAHLVDTSDLTIDQVVAEITQLVNRVDEK